ncbi:MAG: hypothetical protein LBD18_07305 [Treponema sp.]|jgi:hypothetical protein|nr:hypothetical protein [Treponema sp.]
MKKLLLVCVLGLGLVVTGVFADHPSGLGIGVLGRFGYGAGGGFGGGALSLKLPKIPIFWGVNAGIGTNFFSVGITGDNYLIDQTLTTIGGSVPFGWYLGLGGYFDFANWTWKDAYYWNGKWNNYSRTNLGLGVRVPIGIDLQIPISTIKLEVFLEAALSLGLGIYLYDDSQYWKDNKGSSVGFEWGIPASVGVRLWI